MPDGVKTLIGILIIIIVGVVLAIIGIQHEHLTKIRDEKAELKILNQDLEKKNEELEKETKQLKDTIKDLETELAKFDKKRARMKKKEEVLAAFGQKQNEKEGKE